MVSNVRSRYVIMIILIMLIVVPAGAEAKTFGWDTTSQSAISKYGCLYHVVTECYFVFGVVVTKRTTEKLVRCGEKCEGLNLPPSTTYRKNRRLPRSDPGRKKCVNKIINH